MLTRVTAGEPSAASMVPSAANRAFRSKVRACRRACASTLWRTLSRLVSDMDFFCGLESTGNYKGPVHSRVTTPDGVGFHLR